MLLDGGEFLRESSPGCLSRGVRLAVHAEHGKHAERVSPLLVARMRRWRDREMVLCEDIDSNNNNMNNMRTACIIIFQFSSSTGYIVIPILKFVGVSG